MSRGRNVAHAARVPLIVVSPFTKKNYVSHPVADTTAILKFIETRFGLSSLTAREVSNLARYGKIPAWSAVVTRLRQAHNRRIVMDATPQVL